MTDWRIDNVAWDAQRDALLDIRYRVFVDEQGVPAELEHDAQDAHALHLLARTHDKTPFATARMLDDGHIGRIAVLPEWRGRGVGSALLEALIAIAQDQRRPAVYLHAQCRAEGFYRRLGFVAEGAVFDDAGIAHRRMSLRLPVDGG
jgi:predicted GNAT family N-acyltransferase